MGEVRLPNVFGSNMVLQQQKPIVVWGWDAPGTPVTVTLGTESAQATTDSKSQWKATLPAMEADGKTYTMTVQGSTAVTFENVVLGEVWLASGQSNMDLWLDDRVAKTADFPDLRLLHVEKQINANPQANIKGAWAACSPASAHGFSGAAFFYGLELQKNLKVPVGIIQAAVSGSPIEAWTPPQGFAMLPAGIKPPGKGMWPWPVQLYDGMIHPLVPFSIRGTVWYQGEANRDEGASYTDRMKALVGSWRKLWGDDFAFYFVQIGPLEYPYQGPGVGPVFWEAQAAAAKEIPNAGMIVINDIASLHGDVASLQLHPPNKRDVGKRLALLALAKTYGQKDLVYSGPTFQAMTLEGDKIRVTFDNVGSGLVARDGKPLTYFEIVDADQGDFVPATADIDGASIVLSSPDVRKPVAMRFAWANTAIPNLMNKEGLPAGAFRAGDVPDRLAKAVAPPPAPVLTPTSSPPVPSHN
jgi:sialate O-acetylesterase